MVEHAPGPAGPARPRSGVSLLGIATAIFAAVGSLMIVVIMLLINADVFGRFVFNAPVPIVAEIVSVTIVSVVFLQLGDAIRAGRMIQSDMWLSRLARRSPRGATALSALHHIVGAVMLGILAWYIWQPTLASFSPHRTVGIRGVMTLPLWPFYLAVFAGAALAFVQYVATALALIRDTVRGPVPEPGAGDGA